MEEQRTEREKRESSWGWGWKARQAVTEGEKCAGQRSAATGEAATRTRAPLGSPGCAPRAEPGRGARPPLTFQDEGVDVPVDAQEVALPPEARVGGEQRPAALGVQPSEP